MANAAITVDLNARIAQFETELKKATGTLDNFGKKGDQIAAGFKTAFGALGAAVSVGAFAGFIKSSIDAQDAISKLSQKTGIAVESLAGLQHAANLSDVGVDQLAKGVRTFSVAVSESARGMKTYQDKLTALGLDYKKLQGLSPEDQFYALADAVQKLGKEDRAVAVTSALGDKMSVLVPLLSGGADGLRQMVEEGQKYNPVTAESARLAEEFNDNLTRLQAYAGRAGIALSMEFLPALNRVIERLEKLSTLRDAGATIGEILSGRINANTAAGLKKINEDITGIESTIARLRKNSGGKDQSIIPLESELARLKTLRAAMQVMEVDRLMVPPGREKAAGDAGVKEGVAYADGVSKGLKTAKVKLDEIDPFGNQRRAALKAYQDQIDETDKLVREHLLKTMQEVHYESVTAWEEAGQALTDSMQTPAEKLTQQLEYIQQLLDKGVITPETFNRATAAARESFDEIGKEAERMSDSITDSLTDALMRGFEGGKGWARNFADTLKNMFSTLVLRPLIEPIAKGGASMVTGALGMGSSGASAGGLVSSGGSLLNMGGAAAGYMGSLGTMASYGGAALSGGAIAGATQGGMLAAQTGAFGAFGASSTAGALGGASAALAAVPVWGWAALAALAIFGLSGSKPSDKSGWSSVDLGSGESLGTGGLEGKKFSQENRDAAKATTDVGAAYASMLTDLGATIGGALKIEIGDRDGMKADLDNDGKWDIIEKDQKIFFDKLFDSMTKSATGLDSVLKDLLISFDGTTEQMLEFAGALVAINDYMSADLMTDALDQIEQAGRSTWQTWQAGNTELRTLTANFDGSLASATALADATRNQYQLELTLIGQIQGLLVSTNAMFGNSIEQIMLSNMDAAQQYDYWRAEVDKDYADLLAATDPAEIARLSGEINQGSMNAYGLLEDDQKAALAPEFIAYLENADTLTTERLNASQDAIVATHADLTASIEAAMNVAAEKMMEAAQVQLAAAQTPVAVNVTVESTVIGSTLYEVGG